MPLGVDVGSSRSALVLGATLIAVSFMMACQTAEGADCAAFGPDQRYCEITLNGWQVRPRATLLREQPALVQEAIDLIALRLAEMVHHLPPARVAELRRMPIWLEETTPGMERPHYEPGGSDWARANGYPDAMTGSVVIADVRQFLSIRKTQPSILLHELAHGFHDQVLGWGDKSILDAFAHAAQSGLYRAVPRNTGGTGRAYALANAREYFAELTEAYFGENDFFPFRRDELQAYDPVGFAALRMAWEETPPMPERVLDIGSGQRDAGACSTEASMASHRHDRATRIVFRNDLPKPLLLFWLDYTGKRRSYGEVPAGGLKVQETYLTHPWVVAMDEVCCLDIVLPEENGLWVRVTR